MPDVDVSDAAQQVARSEPMGWAARVGLTARAVVYLVMGWLVILIASGGRAQADQRGVLTQIVTKPLGMLMVLLLAIGFALYALWRLSEVFVGVTGEPDGPLPRATSLVRALAYGLLTLIAISVLLGARHTQSGDQEQMAQSLLPTTGGRVVVGLVGLGFLAVGGYMIYQGVTTAFLRYFSTLPAQWRTAVVWFGRIGTTARGIVFAIAGGLAVAAAWQIDPNKAGGIDDAVRTTMDAQGGTAIVVGLGAGLMIFGLYGLAETAWRRVPDQEVT